MGAKKLTTASEYLAQAKSFWAAVDRETEMEAQGKIAYIEEARRLDDYALTMAVYAQVLTTNEWTPKNANTQRIAAQKAYKAGKAILFVIGDPHRFCEGPCSH
jgi:hypothetical protein